MDCAATYKCAKCRVEPSESDGWVAQTSDRHAGPYLSREIALRVAIADAKALHKSGRSVRLTVTDDAGEVYAQRCLCGHVKR